jgi:hypothetical protein
MHTVDKIHSTHYDFGRGMRGVSSTTRAAAGSIDLAAGESLDTFYVLNSLRHEPGRHVGDKRAFVRVEEAVAVYDAGVASRRVREILTISLSGLLKVAQLDSVRAAKLGFLGRQSRHFFWAEADIDGGDVARRHVFGDSVMRSGLKWGR